MSSSPFGARRVVAAGSASPKSALRDSPVYRVSLILVAINKHKASASPTIPAHTIKATADQYASPVAMI